MMAILAVELDVGSGDVPRILIFGTARYLYCVINCDVNVLNFSLRSTDIEIGSRRA